MNRKINYPRLDSKNVFYYSDGTGRDSYIINDAGGLTKKKLTDERKKPVDTTSPFVFFSSPKRSSNWSIDARIQHYHSDGSGRDYYITHNEGGLSRPFTQASRPESIFNNTLRNYQKLSHMRKSQNSLVNREDILRSSWVSQQQEITSMRLSQPKAHCFKKLKKSKKD